MGILIRQKDDEWNVSIREVWYCTDKKECNEVVDFLLEQTLPFSIIYSYELFEIHMNECVSNNTDFKEFQQFLKLLLKMKAKYGHKTGENNGEHY